MFLAYLYIAMQIGMQECKQVMSCNSACKSVRNSSDAIEAI